MLWYFVFILRELKGEQIESVNWGGWGHWIGKFIK